MGNKCTAEYGDRSLETPPEPVTIVTDCTCEKSVILKFRPNHWQIGKHTFTVLTDSGNTFLTVESTGSLLETAKTLKDLNGGPLLTVKRKVWHLQFASHILPSDGEHKGVEPVVTITEGKYCAATYRQQLSAAGHMLTLLGRRGSYVLFLGNPDQSGSDEQGELGANLLYPGGVLIAKITKHRTPRKEDWGLGKGISGWQVEIAPDVDIPFVLAVALSLVDMEAYQSSQQTGAGAGVAAIF